MGRTVKGALDFEQRPSILECYVIVAWIPCLSKYKEVLCGGVLQVMIARHAYDGKGRWKKVQRQ